MIILDTTLSTVDIFISGTPVNIVYTATFTDVTTTTNSTSGVQGILTSSGLQTIVPAPTAGITRVVNEMTFHNEDTTSGNLITPHKTVSGTSYDLNSDIVFPLDSTIFYTSNAAWTIYTSGGSRINQISTGGNMQTFATPGEFLWTKPSGFIPKFVRVICVGAGGGGGAGCAATSGSDKFSSTGGGGGAYNSRLFDAKDLGNTEIVVVGAGGMGGMGVIGTTGGNGQLGGSSTFGGFGGAFQIPGAGTTTANFNITNLVYAGGGGPGAGGASSAARTGGPGGGHHAQGGEHNAASAAAIGGRPGEIITLAQFGQGAYGSITISGTTHNAVYGGGAGAGRTATIGQCMSGGSSMFGGGGGGAGWSFTAAASSRNPGSCGGSSKTYFWGNGDLFYFLSGIISGGNPGGVSGVGASGMDGNHFHGGGGGGGGGAISWTSLTTNPEAHGHPGGPGGTPGGGGGGGGFGFGTVSSGGMGGRGGDGKVWVISF